MVVEGLLSTPEPSCSVEAASTANVLGLSASLLLTCVPESTQTLLYPMETCLSCTVTCVVVSRPHIAVMRAHTDAKGRFAVRKTTVAMLGARMITIRMMAQVLRAVDRCGEQNLFEYVVISAELFEYVCQGCFKESGECLDSTSDCIRYMCFQFRSASTMAK